VIWREVVALLLNGGCVLLIFNHKN